MMLAEIVLLVAALCVVWWGAVVCAVTLKKVGSEARQEAQKLLVTG
jgi:hypothetical protein